MKKIGIALLYLPAFLLFLLSYVTFAVIARVLLTFFRWDEAGLIRDYFLPLLIGGLVGFLGVLIAIKVVRFVFSGLRLRPLAWMIAVLVGVLWVVAGGTILYGDPDEEVATLSEMAAQSLVAAIASLLLTTNRIVAEPA